MILPELLIFFSKKLNLKIIILADNNKQKPVHGLSLPLFLLSNPPDRANRKISSEMLHFLFSPPSDHKL